MSTAALLLLPSSSSPGSSFSANMMFHANRGHSNTNAKRKLSKLEEIIQSLSTQTQNSSEEEMTSEDKFSSAPTSQLQPKPKRRRSNSNKKQKTEATIKVTEEKPETPKMDSLDYESTASDVTSSPPSGLVESIRADFFQHQQESESGLREQIHQQQQSSAPLHPQAADSPSSQPELDSATQSPNASGNPVKVTNVYRGLYPIKNVKEYFKKKTVDNQKLYICQWPGCNFQTWKYSQHISRHIYLKHIGIKELRCQVANCEKVFKRPESLVQHVKNHICGFGIDPVRMKDPNNTCGVKNIKRHFNKIMDNDIQVFMCQFENCKFVTNNSGSIRRHVHNQHICPHSSPAAANSNQRANNSNSANSTRSATPSSSEANSNNGNSRPATITTLANNNIQSNPSPLAFLNHFTMSSNVSSPANSITTDEEPSPAFNPLVMLTEFEGQTYDPVNRTINLMHQANASEGANSDTDSIADMPMDFSLPRAISANLNRLDADEDEEEEESAEMTIDNDEEMGETNMATNASASPSLANGQFNPSAYAVYGMPSNSSVQPMPNFYENAIAAGGPASMVSSVAMQTAAAEAARNRKNNGLYSLKNYKEHYYKIKTPESGVQFICKGCKFQAKSQITLIRHLWSELGYKEFHCEFEGCDRTFDNEFSRYKHRKFDHGQPNQPMMATDPANALIMPARPDSGSGMMLGQDRSYSPSIPPLVPMVMPSQASPMSMSLSSTLNPNYNSIASTLLSLGHPASSVSSIPSTNTMAPTASSAYLSSLSNYLPPPGMYVPITSSSLLPPISTGTHLGMTNIAPLTSTNPLMNLPRLSSTTSGYLPPTFTMPPLSSSSPSRRHSGSSTTSTASEQSAAVAAGQQLPLATTNSSLISILQAPPAANAITANQISSVFGAGQESSNASSLFAGGVPSFASPLSNGLPVAESSPSVTLSPSYPMRRQSGIFSLRAYADQIERQITPLGDTVYHCRLCEKYSVRSQVSITKHMRAHERGEIPASSLAVNNSGSALAVAQAAAALAAEQQRSTASPVLPTAEDIRPRASSILSSHSVSGALSPPSGRSDEDAEDEDREISVEDDGPLNESLYSNASNSELDSSMGQFGGPSTSTGTGAQANVRKYNIRSKSGLYSLKKHESDYVRSKGPDGYHYKCVNCDEYTTKSQASMVRHIWTHKKQNFRCDCGESFENEFSLYKHKKTTHPELTSQHNRSSSKNKHQHNERNNNKESSAGASASMTAIGNSPSTAAATLTSAGSGLEQFKPSNTSEPDLQQQQELLHWLSSAQQLHHIQMAIQQMQQQQGHQQLPANAQTVNPNWDLPNYMFAQNLAQIYQNIHNNNNEAMDEIKEEIEGEGASENKESIPANQKGMSRRALRFKSRKSKPVQIKPQDGEEADEEDSDGNNNDNLDTKQA